MRFLDVKSKNFVLSFRQDVIMLEGRFLVVKKETVEVFFSVSNRFR